MRLNNIDLLARFVRAIERRQRERDHGRGHKVAEREARRLAEEIVQRLGNDATEEMIERVMGEEFTIGR